MKPCHALNMFLTFWRWKPYVRIWFALIRENVKSKCKVFVGFWDFIISDGFVLMTLFILVLL